MSARAVIGLAVVAVTAAGTVVLLGGRVSAGPALPRVEQVEARATFSGEIHRFGDLIEARIDVFAPAANVDSGSIKVVATFTPYRPAEPAHVERRRSSKTVLARYLFRLECLDTGCVPSADRAGFEFPPANVEYRLRNGEPRRATVAWPGLVVLPRPRGDLFTPWEDGLTPLPAPTFRIPPRVAAGLGVGLASLALLGAAWLVRPLVRSTRTTTAGFSTSPLQRAIAAVRAAAARDDIDERRRALDLLSRVLPRRHEGASGHVTAVAWSRPPPARAVMEELADSAENG